MISAEREGTMAPTSRLVLRSDTDSVVLLQPIQADAPLIYSLVDSNREHLGHFTEVALHLSSLEVVQRVIAYDGNPNMHRFGIWDDETLVGMINLSVFGRDSILNWWVGKDHIGQKYSSRAGVLLLDFAFNQLGLQDVGCYINPKNEASRRSALRLGMVPAFVGENTMRYIISNPNTPTRPVPNVATSEVGLTR